MTPDVSARLKEMMEHGTQEYKDMMSRHKVKYSEIPMALRFGVFFSEAEESVWATEVSAKVLGYIDRLKRIDNIDKFFALCKRVQDEIRSIRRYVYQESIKAYGNAIVPAVIYEIMKACLDSVDKMREVGSVSHV